MPDIPRLAARACIAGLLAAACHGGAVAQGLPAPPILPLSGEPGATLSIHAPVPAALARGVIILQYRTEHLRIMPVFGPKAAEVSPRIGHLHVTVDKGPATWAHTSLDPIIIVGLAPGPHTIRLELADPTHRILGGETVEVTVPDSRPPKAAAH